MKKIIILSLTTLVAGLLSTISTSALTYQNDTDVDFTINPTISVSLSGDLLINDLVPGSYNDSNIITVNVATNASHGYYLAATVGDSNSSSSNHNTALNHSDNNSYTFTNLSSNVTSLSDFSDNQWGYSYSTDNGSTWVSGNAGNASTGYNGLPLDNDDSGATGITLINTTSPVADNSIKFKIGAKASNTQPSGTYTNTINFYAVTYAGPVTFDDAFAAAGKTKLFNYYTMQDMTSSICSTIDIEQATTLIDTRDNQTYKIAKLKDGNCWMLDNLNLGANTSLQNLTENNTNTNTSITTEAFTQWNRDISGTSESYSDPKFSIVSGTDPVSNTTYGTLYNYCAASAKTYCYENGQGIDLPNTLLDSPHDICPYGWRLPTGGPKSEFDSLYNQYNTYAKMRAQISDGGAAFALAGSFAEGATNEQGRYGLYWSSSAYNGQIMYDLFLEEPKSFVHIAYGDNRSYGRTIRCLAK